MFTDKESEHKWLLRKTRALVKTTDFETLWADMAKRKTRLSKYNNYIYGLADPRDNRIRYVGKTKTFLSYRLYQHIRESKTSKSYRARWIRGLLSEGYEPRIVLICSVAEDKASQMEYWLIHRFDYEVGPLVNHEIVEEHLQELMISIHKKNKFDIELTEKDFQIKKPRWLEEVLFKPMSRRGSKSSP